MRLTIKKTLLSLSILLSLSCAVSAQAPQGGMVPCGGGNMVPNCSTASLSAPTQLVGSDIDLNFQSGVYFGALPANLTVVRTTSAATDLTYLDSPGQTFSSYAAGTLRIRNGRGLLIEETRINNLLASGSPATQTTASLGTGTYCLWVNGTGTATPSAGTATISGAAAASNYAPNIFSISGAGTVVVTVSGSLNEFQLEAGASCSSYIPTTAATVTRNGDVISFTTVPPFGAAYTLYGQIIPLVPTAYAVSTYLMSADDATLNNRAGIFRDTTDAHASFNITVGGVSQGQSTAQAAFTQGVRGKLAASFAAGAQAGSLNGAAVSTLAGASIPAPTALHVGVRADGANTTQCNCFMERLGVWESSAITNGALITATTLP